MRSYAYQRGCQAGVHAFASEADRDRWVGHVRTREAIPSGKAYQWAMADGYLYVHGVGSEWPIATKAA